MSAYEYIARYEQLRGGIKSVHEKQNYALTQQLRSESATKPGWTAKPINRKIRLRPLSTTTPAEGAVEVRLGKVVTAFSSGTKLLLDPCDITGTDNGELSLQVWVMANQGTYTMYTGTTIAANTVVPFVLGDDGDWYVFGIGRVEEVITDYDTTNHRDVAKYRDAWGFFTGTTSDWVTIHQYVSRVVMEYVSGPDGDGCYEVTTEVIWVPEAQTGSS